MYINFDYLSQKDISSDTLMVLLAVKQKETNHPFFDTVMVECQLTTLEELELIETMKSKKGEYKLTKKGRALIRDLQIANVSPEAKSCVASMVESYKAFGLGDKIGSKPKSIAYVSQILSMGYSCEDLLEAVEAYLESKKGQEREFIAYLEKLIFKPSNMYSTKFKPEESRLLQYIGK